MCVCVHVSVYVWGKGLVWRWTLLAGTETSSSSSSSETGVIYIKERTFCTWNHQFPFEKTFYDIFYKLHVKKTNNGSRCRSTPAFNQNIFPRDRLYFVKLCSTNRNKTSDLVDDYQKSSWRFKTFWVVRFLRYFSQQETGTWIEHHQPNGRFTLVCWMFILCEPPELYSEMLLCSK